MGNPLAEDAPIHKDQIRRYPSLGNSLAKLNEDDTIVDRLTEIARLGVESVRPSIPTILAKRDSTHGHFELVSKVSQEIKEAFRWGPSELTSEQREALDHIATKMARIVCGDPNFHDHWVDIVGYATLAADRCKKQD